MSLPKLSCARRQAAASLAGVLALAACLASAPLSAQLLDDKSNLKILSTRSKMLLLNQHYFDDLLKEKGVPTSESELQQYVGRVGCGSVDIGNQYVDSGISREISVVILGDVINYGNRCAK